MLSTILAKRNHDVHLFTCHTNPHNIPKIWEGVKLYNLQDRIKIIDDTFDTVIAINEPNYLMDISQKPFKILWQF